MAEWPNALDLGSSVNDVGFKSLLPPTGFERIYKFLKPFFNPISNEFLTPYNLHVILSLSVLAMFPAFSIYMSIYVSVVISECPSQTELLSS